MTDKIEGALILRFRSGDDHGRPDRREMIQTRRRAGAWSEVMKLLLTQDVSHLGIVGDVINVSAGYARNYLVPHGIATEATPANVRALAEERKKAEERRRLRMEEMRQRAERLRDVEVTIAAAANEEGVLYGSVGPREIAAALRDEGHTVEAANVQMRETIGRLDNVSVRVKFAEAIETDVKVWVVRSQATPEGEGAEEGDEERGATSNES